MSEDGVRPETFEEMAVQTERGLRPEGDLETGPTTMREAQAGQRDPDGSSGRVSLERLQQLYEQGDKNSLEVRILGHLIKLLDEGNDNPGAQLLDMAHAYEDIEDDQEKERYRRLIGPYLEDYKEIVLDKFRARELANIKKGVSEMYNLGWIVKYLKTMSRYGADVADFAKEVSNFVNEILTEDPNHEVANANYDMRAINDIASGMKFY